MERRIFLRAGLAWGAAGVAGCGTLARSAPAPAPAPIPRSTGQLRLSSNENPLGLSPAARRAVIDGIAEANRYPGGPRRELIKVLAAKHHVAPESIVLGAGSTEVLQMTVQAIANSNVRLVLAEPTFEDVPRYTAPYAYRLETVPLDGRFAHDMERMQERTLRSKDAVLVYICNPNNPTATLTPCDETDAWIEAAEQNVYFLVDEAYYEFVDDTSYWSSIKWIEDRPNVVVVRTFSKIYGMAGMRLGYGIAHPDTATRIRQYISHNNANHLALVAALASLRDTELVSRSLEANERARRTLYRCLDELDLEYVPSHTNFVMHRINGDLESYIGRMRENGVRVGRPFPPMLSYNRLSIGLPEEMARFAEILRTFRRRGWV